MNKKLERSLMDDFPKLFPGGRSARGSILFFGFECEDGWYDLIRELAEKITPLLTNCPEFPGDLMHTVQVKEKFGTLRFYMNCETNAISKLIEEYEVKSSHICEYCGKSGSTRPGGWVRTLCDGHYRDGI